MNRIFNCIRGIGICWYFLSTVRLECQKLSARGINSGGGQGGLNFPLPVPFNPGSRPVFLAPALCIFSIAKHCAMLRNFPLFLPLPATLGIPLPAPSSPTSRTPPAPFSPGLPPPCPLPTQYKCWHLVSLKIAFHVVTICLIFLQGFSVFVFTYSFSRKILAVSVSSWLVMS